MNVIQPPHPVLDKRGEPHVRRYEEQRWLIDNVIRASGIDGTGRARFRNGPAAASERRFRRHPRAREEDGGYRPAFEAVARRREAKAQADEEIGHKVTACDNYFIAAVHWGAAQWPYDQIIETNIACNDKKRECYAKYARSPIIHRAGMGAVQGQGDPGLVPSAARLQGGRIPVVINVPGWTASRRSRSPLRRPLLNRGIAVLAIDGPADIVARMVAE